MSITIIFNVKSRSKATAIALELLQGHLPVMVDKSFGKFEISLADPILHQLGNAISKLKGTQFLINGEMLEWNAIESIYFCRKKSECDGVCSHISLLYLFGGLQETGLKYQLIRIKDYLKQHSWNEYIIDKTKIRQEIDEKYKSERLHCEKYSETKVLARVNEIPSKFRTSRKLEVEIDLNLFDILNTIKNRLNLSLGKDYSSDEILNMALEDFGRHVWLDQLARRLIQPSYPFGRIPYTDQFWNKLWGEENKKSALYDNFIPPEMDNFEFWKRTRIRTTLTGPWLLMKGIQWFIANLNTEEEEYFRAAFRLPREEFQKFMERGSFDTWRYDPELEGYRYDNSELISKVRKSSRFHFLTWFSEYASKSS